MTNSTFSALVGRTIKKISVNDNQEILSFDTDGGSISFKGYGDCCSETWFADITGVDFLLNARIMSVEDVEMESVDDGRTRQDSDSFYGVKIHTDKGSADVIYRNSSNGYYGDNAELFTGKLSDMTEITKDWQAGHAE